MDLGDPFLIAGLGLAFVVFVALLLRGGRVRLPFVFRGGSWSSEPTVRTRVVDTDSPDELDVALREMDLPPDAEAKVRELARRAR